ncbi:MAG TPA: 30S ribosomal protein S17 [Gemmatimonadales bacterium]|nr:30S ribosomal protein S17 [Gemmatimonadales bacterium]
MSERKTREAVVISDKMQKTRVVRIERVHRHPRYERVVRSAKRLKVHDEANVSRVGDRVLIEETRPMSRDKRWRIRQIVKVNETARTLAVPGADAVTPTSNRPPTAQAG